MSARRSTRSKTACATIRNSASARPFVEEVVDALRGLGADAGHLLEVGERCAFDRLERPEVMQQRTLARRADAGDLLQAGVSNVALALLPMRADREAMRLVAQPLDEIQNRIARRQPERFAAGHVERLAAGVAVGPLGDADQRHTSRAEPGEDLARRVELADAAVD